MPHCEFQDRVVLVGWAWVRRRPVRAPRRAPRGETSMFVLDAITRATRAAKSWELVETNGNQWEPAVTSRDQWEPVETGWNKWKPVKTGENR